MEEYNEAVDGNHTKLFEFSAVTTYVYPCESKLTALGKGLHSSTFQLNLSRY
jgi:hypothetical protein